jgi:hypothetical protein
LYLARVRRGTQREASVAGTDVEHPLPAEDPDPAVLPELVQGRGTEGG